MAIENVFSWSKSRDEQFRECPRKYFYDKYASWGGWERNAPPRTRLAYVLKNLKNRWAWKGETVHHLIEDVLKGLRSGQPLSLEAALARLTKIMRADYLASKAKKYFEEPKKSLGLFEHEYSKAVSDETWKNMHDSAADCVRNFYRSKLYEGLLADDRNSWLVIEDLEEFDFEGAKIFVKLDFARKKDEKIEIFDWKTGKANGHDALLQIGTYAIFAMQKWGVPLEDLRACLVNLSTPIPVPQDQPITAELIQNTQVAMRESIARMRELLVDPSKNIPKPEDNFKFTENLTLCNNCNFYKICEKYNSP